MKTNHEWTPINTNRPEDGWTSFNHKRRQTLLQLCAPGVTMSWDEGFPGARASRPHQAWHSLGHLPHWDQPGTAPWLSFGLAAAVPAGRVAACSIAPKHSRGQRHRMRAGRPRSRAMPSRRRSGGCLAGDFSESRPAPLGETPVCPRAVILPPDRADHSRVKQRIIVAYPEQEIGVESFYGIRVSRRRAPWLTRTTSIP